MVHDGVYEEGWETFKDFVHAHSLDFVNGLIDLFVYMHQNIADHTVSTISSVLHVYYTETNANNF